MTDSKLEINLGEYLGEEVVCTLRHGGTLQGEVEKATLDNYNVGTHPYRISGDCLSYRPEGRVSCLKETDRDIVSIKLINHGVNLKDYVGDPVRCTLRDGTMVEGMVELVETATPKFPPGTHFSNPYTISEHSYAYTNSGCYRGNLASPKDIVSIERIGPMKSPYESSYEKIMREIEKLSADDIRELEAHIKELKDTDPRFLRGYKVEVCVRFSDQDLPEPDQMKEYVEALLLDRDSFSQETGVDSSDISLTKITEIAGQSFDQFEWSNE